MRLRKRQSEIEGGIKKVGLDVMTKGGNVFAETSEARHFQS